MKRQLQSTCLAMAAFSLLAMLPRFTWAQTDTIHNQPDYLNQLYDGAPTNAPGTSLAQAASIAICSGNIGDITNAPSPGDGQVYLTQSIIGQSVGGVPFSFLLPGIVFNTPASGTVLGVPGTVALSAQAWHLDGIVTQVNFYASGGTIGTNVPLGAPITNSMPGTNTFQLTWTGVPSGSYTLAAVAMDNRGNSTTSAPVNISVVPVIYVSVNGQPTNSTNFSILATNNIQVAMTNPFPGGFIFYTTDGSDPNGGQQYTAPFPVSGSATIRALLLDQTFLPLYETYPVTITFVPLYNLVGSSPGGGSVTLSPPAGQYPSNTVVTLTATNAPGWTFLNWTGDVPTNASTFNLVMNANHSVQAIFGTPMTVLPSSLGAVSVSPTQSNYAFGSTVRLTAVPIPTNYFRFWGGAALGASNSPLDFVINTGRPTNSAVFGVIPSNQFTLNLQVGSGNGTVTRAPFGPLYAGGASVTVTATTNAGQAFTGWSGSASGTQNPLPVTITSNLTIIANFSATAPPSVTITNPIAEAAFNAPATVTISATASDPLGMITQIAFLAGTTQLAALTNAPFTFSWTNAPAGTNVLTAVATDNLGLSATSAPVSITVLQQPIFQFSTNNYFVNESNGAVSVLVTNSGDQAGLVNYTTADGTAYGGHGYSGDYTISSGSVNLGGHQTNTIVVPIIDNFLDRSNVSFQVQLFGPSAGMLGNPAVASVTIFENDLGGATNSLLTRAVPSPMPATNSSLTVVLNPPEAGGQWRFPWDQAWRQSGQSATGLPADNYPVQFRNVPGYLAYPPNLTVVVTNNGPTVVTNQYYPTLLLTDTNSTGSLTVNILNAPAGAGWRFIGETNWRLPNTSAGGLLPDVYFLEFEPVSTYAKPASRAEQVFGGHGNTISVSYLLASSLPSDVSPKAVTPGPLNDPVHYPYGFNGQLYTDAGFGSGVAMRSNVVLTAAHMVFNDASLSYVNQAYWSFEQEGTAFGPDPLPARGWYVLSGYAAQRTNDQKIDGYGADQSSPQSRELDVAALYFLSLSSRGGYGGYLTSDATPNPWLTGSDLKMLVGYPVDGSQYGDASIVPGTMYTTPEQPPQTALSLSSNDVYTASWFISYPGNSGGPFYVQFNTNYYPAGVYLGTVGSGQNSVSAVRAITSDVVNLINLAASLGDAGTNHTGGGVVTLIAGGVTAANPAWLQVWLGPPAAVQAGAGWRLQGSTNQYGTSSNFTLTITTSNAALEFKPVNGWNLPVSSPEPVSAGALNIISNLFYTVAPPVMVADPARGIGLSGAAVRYRIDYRTNLGTGQWLPLQTNTIGTGTNFLLPWPPTNNVPRAFYRAVWLP